MATDMTPRSDRAPASPQTPGDVGVGVSTVARNGAARTPVPAPGHVERTTEAGAHARIRPEIQALRAIAVGLVVACHLWPKAVPGGFVGVDVFFAISGFLITSILL